MDLYTQLFNKTYIENWRVILGMVERNELATILDCGCGSGDFTREIAAKIGANKVYGIEYIEESAKLARTEGN